MDTEPVRGYGIRCSNDNHQWLWWKIHVSKKYANDYMLIRFSEESGTLLSPDVINCTRRASELRRIKKKHGLKVVKVKMIEDVG